MDRRKFIKKTGLAIGGTTLLGTAGVSTLSSKIKKGGDSAKLVEGAKQWRNWSGNQTCRPAEMFLPNSTDELVAKIKNTKNKIRVVGGGHSFSPVVPTSDVLASLSNLKGVISQKSGTHEATLAAGSHLYDLTKELHKIGLAFPNQGDIDKQSLGGAVSTSTHGTGATFQSFAGGVKGFRMVTANGDLLNCNAQENSEIFYAGAVSLGALGIVTEYDMQLVPSYKLKEKIYPEKTSQILENFDALVEANEHFEFMPFLHADIALVKTLNSTDEDVTPKEESLLNDDILMSASLVVAQQKIDRVEKLQSIAGSLIAEEERVGYSHEIYPSERNVRFNEMEYEVPREHGMACVREIIEFVQAKKYPVFFPLEVRTVKSDEFWMSPFYQRDTVAISVHRFAEYEYVEYFSALEKICQKYQGRPHWGKLAFIDASYIKEVYPRFNDFVSMKKRLDPGSRFSNDYVTKLFGV